MSYRRNPIIRFLNFAVMLTGSLLLVASLYQFVFSPPSWRFWSLAVLAVVLTWPKINLPVKIAEPILFLSLLMQGVPSGIMLAALITAVAARTFLPQHPRKFFVQIGQSICAAGAGGLVVIYLPLFLEKNFSFSDSSISLLYVLVWMAFLKFLLQANWASLIQAIEQKRLIEKFTEGIWLNGFVADFGAALIAGILWLALRKQPQQLTLLSLLIVTVFYFAYRHLKNKYVEKYRSIYDNAEELSDLHLRTIEALSTAIAAKDQQSHLQARRVQAYTERIGKALALSEDELKALRAASLLRDIGKLAVPDYILHKSGKLTDAEQEKMKMHPVIGASILERVGFPYPLVPAIKHHHEYWDGTGYPDHLHADEIPLTSRILSVVDEFDAICGTHPTAASKEKAINLLMRESGRKYDPQVVRAFLELLPTLQIETSLAALSSQDQVPLSAYPAPTPQNVYLDAIHRARQEGSELLDLAQALSSTLNLEEAISIIISRLSRLTTFDTYAICVCEESNHTAYVAGAIGAYADELRAHQILIGSGAIGQALLTGQRVYGANAALEFVAFETKIRQAFASMTILPLGKAGRVIGALVLLSKLPDGYSVENQRVVEMVVPLAADALFNAFAFRRTETSAITDPLTALPNSRMLQIIFDEESNRADRYETKLSMLMIDLDGFKQVNDTFGHLAGDQVLREVAHCLKQELRASDKLIRYAGDEFVALLPHADEKSIRDLITRIQNYLESCCHLINGIEVRVGASIGYAIFGRDGKTLNELMRVADEGMYRNKSIRKKLIKPRRLNLSPSAQSNEGTNLIFTEAVAS